MTQTCKRLTLPVLALLSAVALPITLANISGNNIARADAGSTPSLQAAEAPEPPAPNNPRAVKNVTVKDGFMVELLHETKKGEQGSWVALCAGPNNTLYASSQYNGKKGANHPTLFQLKPPAVDDPNGKTQVIAQPVDLAGAQGLCYAFGSLYVMESGRQNGLVRVSDTDGDGLLDKKELLLNIFGGGEHGTHAIVPTPDGKGLFLVAGNMSPLPAKVDKSRPVFGLWDEDHVLPRNRDGRGHASNVMAPGGWIVRVDPDGKNVELISQGYRNQYDIGVHPNGEVFAYDADMEWDLGQPWYRPTRINHVTSGSEFGWRNGSGKWPKYYEDSLDSVVDIGPGSPVGVTFGTGAAFPTKYQEALYALDWTYGTIYAIHITPQGSTYTGEIEPFVQGKPLPVTDVAIGGDGHMYFTAGGRRGDSAFYRVSYYGNKDKTPPIIKPHNELALLRKEIEKLHTPDAPADKLDFIWSNLGHSDRYVRFAARVALEHRKPASYVAKAKAEKDALTRTAAGLALARHRHPAALEVLLGVDLKGTDKVTQLAWMRAMAVDMYRKADIDGKTQKRTYDPKHLAKKDAILAKIKGLLPSDDRDINTEVIRLRVALEDEGVIEDALNFMSNTPVAPLPEWTKLAQQNDRYGAAINAMIKNPPPTFQIGIAFMLRNLDKGWTPTTRQQFFSWLRLAAQAGGGNSYWPAMNTINKQAQATLTAEEKAALGPLASGDLPKPDNNRPIVQPKGPGRTWTTAAATKLLNGRLKGRSFERGQGLYQAALCSQCHKVGDLGGDIGPNLSTAANKFSLEDLLRATIEPSHEISDQYALSIVKTKNGKQVIGRVLSKDASTVTVQPNPLDPKTVAVAMGDVQSIELSPTSTMPAGLVNPLSAPELADLCAYILSGGNKDAEYFKK